MAPFALALALALPVEPQAVLRVTPEFDQAGYQALAFSLTFRGEPDGTTVLHLPDAWGGETELWRGVQDLAVEGGTLSAADSPARREVVHPPGASLTVTWRIRQFHAGEPQVTGDNDYRPFVQPGFFHVVGNTAVLHPSSVAQSAPVAVSIGPVRPGDVFASDLEHHTDRTLSMGDLVESIMVGGDFRLIEGGGGIRLAIRGQWDRPDGDWRQVLEALSEGQRAYWGSEAQPYLVTVLPLTDPTGGAISVGGTGRGDAFAFFATVNAPVGTLDQVMSHELMHSWVPGRLGRVSPDASEAEGYWLSEGFTDWASWRTLVRQGLWTEGQFAAAFNDHLRRYDLSPARNLTNAEAADQFWTSEHANRLAYLKGMLLAARWDHAVRTATAGARDFDDVLLAMQARAQAFPEALITLNLRVAMDQVAGIDVGPDIARFVDAGETIALPADLYGACGTLAPLSRPLFHRGFDIEATQAADDIITGVVPGGPAEAAGLRNGMRLIRRTGGTLGEPNEPITYEVQDGERRLSLTWLPQGEGEETFRALALETPGQACRALLAGL